MMEGKGGVVFLVFPMKWCKKVAKNEFSHSSSITNCCQTLSHSGGGGGDSMDDVSQC